MRKMKVCIHNFEIMIGIKGRFFLVVLILFVSLILTAKGQDNRNDNVKLIKSYYNLRARVLHVEKVNEARWVLSNNSRYVGHFNLNGRIETSNLVLSDDTLFVSKRDTIICFNGKTGEK